jgi:hypothetical protein
MPFAPRLAAALSVLGVVALAGCGAPPEGSEKTGSSDEALVDPVNPGKPPPPPPVETILTGAYPGTTGPAGTTTTCGSSPVPVPLALAILGNGCTEGVTFGFPGDLVDEGWAFACQGTVTLPASLGMPGEYTGPANQHAGTETLYTTTTPYFPDNDDTSACFGAARPGWTLVIDIWNTGGSPHGGCPTTGCNTL